MIPDFCEAITAYRVFTVYPNGLLVGQAHVEPWPTFQPFVARCGALSGNGWSGHVVDGRVISAPVFNCDCGIHVLKSQDAARARAVHGRPENTAWGAVKVWGRLIEHEFGYRAEFAYPSALACADTAIAEKIAALYGVPCAVEALPVSTEIFSTRWFYCGAVLQPVTFSPVTFTVDWSDAAPQLKQPAAPMIAPAVKLGANRWQQRQARIHARTPQPRKGFRS